MRVHDFTSDTPPISVVLARDWAEDITLRFVRDNGVLVVYGKNDRYFFDVISRTGAHEISVPLGERYVQNVVVPKDGSKVFIGQAHHVRCFDLQTGNCILKAATWQRQQLVSLRREDSELVILSANRAADRMLTEIWTIATGQHARHWREYSGEWAAQALLTDGETLVVQRCDIAEADGGALELRDLSSGHLIRVLGPWERAGSQVVVPDDGRCLFTGSWRNGIHRQPDLTDFAMYRFAGSSGGWSVGRESR